jgi:hypothetical protein
MCLNETYSDFLIGKYLSDTFAIQNGPKQSDALPPLNHHREGPRKPGGTEIKWDTLAALC